MSHEPHDDPDPRPVLGGAQRSGSVKKADVLKVLRANGVVVASDRQNTLLSKGEVVEVQLLPEWVHRRMIHRFARIFEIEIHLFYHPELLPG